MRILYLCQDHGVSILGRKGCSTHVRETCSALQSAGHEVTVLCSQRGEDTNIALELDIHEVKPRRLRKIGYDLRNVWHNAPLYREARKIVESKKIEAIYERFSLYSFVGTWLSERYSLPRIVEVNAFLTVEHKEKIYFPRFARWAERYVAKHAASLVVVSQPLMDSLVSLGVSSDRIFIMPMAVDIDHFQPNPSRRETMREKLGISSKYVIGYIGGLAGWHGISLLHDMADEMLKERNDFVFLVVGGEPSQVERHTRRAAERNLQNHMIFSGSVPYNQVPAYINAMDVALVPDTNYWTCPTKMFEYQASAVPTIAPKYPAILKAIKHGQEGLLFEPRDVQDAVKQILSIGRDPEQRNLIGQRAMECVRATHSWQHNIQRIIRLFEDMLSGNLPLKGPVPSQYTDSV